MRRYLWTRRLRSFHAAVLGRLSMLPALGLALAFAAPAQAHSPQPGVRASAPSQQALSSTLAQLTGLSPSAVTTENSCQQAPPGSARCLAQILVLRSGHRPIHPHVGARGLRPQVYPAPTSRAVAGAASASASDALGAPDPGTPAYLQQAYDLTYLSQTGGTGDTVAIVDAYDDPTAEQDLAVYRSNFGLPACTSASGCFQKLNQSGQTNNPPPTSPPGDDWEGEISLDLDAVSALCPNCKIRLIEANSEAYSNLIAAEHTAMATGAKQISNSWGGDTALNASDFTHTGVAFIAATGDSGYESSPNYPAALPNVTAAGGTSLAAATDGNGGRGFSESAWSLSDGWGGGTGCNTSVTRPAYQPSLGCSGRALADLSADGDPSTGLSVYDSGNGGWLQIGGTSLASPLIAAYYAITGTAAPDPSWAYNESNLLNDPVSGSTGSCPSNILYICNAGVGYDGPTGVGSISGDIVTGGPGIGGPSAGGRSDGGYVMNVDTTSAKLVGGIYPNGLDTSYWWQYGPTTDYGQQTQPTDVGAGSTPVATNDTLTGLTPGTIYHYRLVAQSSKGRTYGYDFEFTTSTNIPDPPPTGPADSIIYNTKRPSITGIAREGQTLTASSGGWFGTPTAISYRWYSCDYGGADCTTIARATGSTHLLTQTDVGRSLYVAVSATNAGGTASANSPFTGVVSAASPPQVSALKTSASSLRAGRPLTVTLTVSTRATVNISITTRASGRKVGGRCSTSAKRGKRCTTTVNRGSFNFNSATGRHAFSLRLTKLAPGRYTATVTARSSNRTSKQLTFTFTIVR